VADAVLPKPASVAWLPSHLPFPGQFGFSSANASRSAFSLQLGPPSSRFYALLAFVFQLPCSFSATGRLERSQALRARNLLLDEAALERAIRRYEAKRHIDKEGP
jgi:hypothetical protein